VLVSLSTDPLWLRFVSGPDIEQLGLTPADAVAATTDVVAAHGRGETVFEPRTHLVPDNGGRGHFNVLRGHVSSLGDHGVSGVKVVGDFVPNFELGLPSELALLTLYDPWTGVPQAIVDATLITEVRTGAMTAVGARHLARPDSRVLGHVGARGTAHSNVVMLDAMCPHRGGGDAAGGAGVAGDPRAARARVASRALRHGQRTRPAPARRRGQGRRR
jgi:ornithine cyclodeaminase